MKKGKSTKEMGELRKQALEHYLERLGIISDLELSRKYGIGRHTIAA
jgi:hypothetical protein